MKRTLSSLLFVFLLAGLLAVGTASVSAQDPGPGDINLTLEPSDSTVAPNTNQTYDVVVEGPDTGIGAYSNIAVDIGDSSVAEIVSFQENKTGTSVSGIKDNGTSLVIDTALLGNRYGEASELAIAEFTVEAVGSIGDSTNVAYNQSPTQTVLKNSNLRGSNEPVDYNVTGFNDATLTVESGQQPTVQVSDLTPQGATVPAGDSVDISATVTNTGDQQGTQTVTLTVGGVTQTQSVTLAAGANATVAFSVDAGALGPGTYTHVVSTADDSASGTLTVQDQSTQPGQGEINLALDPASAVVDPGETQLYNVTVDGPDNGISAYDSVVVEVADPAVATISSATRYRGGLGDAEILDNGSAVRLDTALLGDTYAPASEIPLAGLTLTTASTPDQSTALEFNLSSGPVVTDVNNSAYEVAAVSSATLSTVDSPEQDDINLSIEPSETAVEAGTDQTYDVVVDGPTDGINAYNNVSIDVTDASVGTITGFVEYATGQNGPLSTSEIQNNGSTLLLNAALLDATYPGASEITVASFNVTAVGSAGQSTAIAFDQTANQQFVDENNTAYTVNAFGDATLTVEGASPTNFAVSNLTLGSPTVLDGTTGTVSATVTNTGGQGTQQVTLAVGTYSDTQTVTLSGAQQQTVTFEIPTAGTTLEPGSYTPTVTTANDSASGSLTVQAPATFQIDTLAPANATVVDGETVNFSATVTNTGDVAGTQSVTLTVGGVVVDAQTTLAGGQTQTVAFTVDTGQVGPGEYTPTVETANDSVAGALTVQREAVVSLRGPDEVFVGQNTTLDVVVDAGAGISGYDMTITASGASIVDYSLNTAGATAPLDNSSIGPDGQSLSLGAALLSGAFSGGESVIATVTVRADAPGTIQVQPAQARVIDPNSRRYAAVRLNGTRLTATGPPPILTNVPTDPDGDGLYENVRGTDRGFTVLDVQTLFNELENPVLQENAQFFQFEPADPDVTVLDVQQLFNELNPPA
jgi:hypothetical protein